MVNKPAVEGSLLQPIGEVRSSLKQIEDCPLQETEGAPQAWLEISGDFQEGLEGLRAGSEIILLTWLHLANRGILKSIVRNNYGSPPTGVFSTRSPNRPNPIGLHQVKILEIKGDGKLLVSPLEVLDGTPILDIKPVINR
jgi:tRNA-Thr(GGU) m(6)t(6)A37 methyltransferase TsaA